MWSLDDWLTPLLVIIREVGSLLFLGAVIYRFPDRVHRQKLIKLLNVWIFIFAITFLVQVLIT